MLSPEEWVQEGEVHDRCDQSEVEVGGQVHQAQAVGDSAVELQAANPLKPAKCKQRSTLFYGTKTDARKTFLWISAISKLE